MSGSTSTYWPAQVQQLRLGDVVLDLRYRRVQRPDGQVELPQRMFDLLLLFTSEPGVLHSRADLFERVWHGVVVEDSNLSQSIWMLRRALGEQRRHWIRTVAKSGYVFDPPTAIEILSAETAGEPQRSVEPTIAAPTPALALWKQLISDIPGSIARPIAAVGALVAIIATANVVNSRTRLVETPPTVALVSIHDPGGSGPSATSLLHGWLEWKLTMTPDVLLLDQAHLASDHGGDVPATLVLLSSGRIADQADRIYVQARIKDGLEPRWIRQEGATEQIAELVDTVAVQTLARLLPEQPRGLPPALRVDSHGVELYHRMYKASVARNWIEAAEIGQTLIQHAPSFGLAHWHLGRVNAVLSRVHPAREHLLAAQRLLAPLSAAAQDLFQAQRLALDGEHEAAAQAYGELVRRYPHRRYLQLELASALSRAGHPRQAREVLATGVWQGQPTGLRLSYYLLSARVELALGNAVAARGHGQQAEILAAEAGWNYERGFAALALADADMAEHRGVFEPHLFDRAAEHFEAAGDSMHALRARIMGEIPRVQADASDTLDALLVQARNAGQRRLELDALHAVAYRHFRAGEIDAYRSRLQQAITLAEVLDDGFASKRLVMDLINEAFMIGDFDQVRQGLATLADAGMQGEAASWIDQFSALLAYRLGELARARETLEAAIARSDDSNGEAAGSPSLRVMHRCLLGVVLLAEGDPSLARSEYAGCNDTKAPVYQLMSETGLASVDLYSGDASAAWSRLSAALERLDEIPSKPDRWLLQLSIAELLIRAGRSDQAWAIYQELLPDLAAAGYWQMLASVRIGLAEIATAQNDWPLAVEQAASARALLSPADWKLNARLSLLDGAILHAQGEFEQSREGLRSLQRQAQGYGDALTQMLAMALVDALESPTRDLIQTEPLRQLIAVTGLRGARHDWLLGAQEHKHQLISIAMEGLRCPAQAAADY